MAHVEHQDRYTPANTNSGWGVAALIIALAAICIITATVIHNKTYRQPTDPTWDSRD